MEYLDNCISKYTNVSISKYTKVSISKRHFSWLTERNLQLSTELSPIADEIVDLRIFAIIEYEESLRLAVSLL